MAEYKNITSLSKQIRDFKKTINSPNSDYMTGYLSALSVVEGMIAGIPSADVVEVVHGEWKETMQPLGFKEVKCVTCSVCDEDWIMDEDECIDDYKTHWKYCPNCGAKMDGDN